MSADFHEIDQTYYSLRVVENYDSQSPTLRAWVIESLDSYGDVIADGIAGTFDLALKELFRDFPSESGGEQ
jgi:hypothetical protein